MEAIQTDPVSALFQELKQIQTGLESALVQGSVESEMGAPYTTSSLITRITAQRFCQLEELRTELDQKVTRENIEDTPLTNLGTDTDSDWRRLIRLQYHTSKQCEININFDVWKLEEKRSGLSMDSVVFLVLPILGLLSIGAICGHFLYGVLCGLIFTLFWIRKVYRKNLAKIETEINKAKQKFLSKHEQQWLARLNNKVTLVEDIK